MDYEGNVEEGHLMHSPQMGFVEFHLPEEVILNEPELTSDTHKMEVKENSSANWQLGEFQLIQRSKMCGGLVLGRLAM